MRRIAILCIALLLLLGCGGKEQPAPQVQMDARAENTAAPVMETAAPQSVSVVSSVAEETVVTEGTVVTEAPAAAKANAAAEAFADKVAAAWQTEGLTKDMYPLTAEDALDYYGIDLAACRSGVVLGDAVGYANEAVVVEADKAGLDEMEALLKDHLSAVKAQYKGYDAEALALAEKAVLLREGDVLLYIVSPNAEEMLAVYRSLKA